MSPLSDVRARLGLAALVLAGLGAALGMPYAPGGPTLAFGVATLAALGTRGGVALGALALLAGLGTPPAPLATLAMPAVGTALAGLGLGLVIRELERLRAVPSNTLGGAVLALVGALAAVLPDGRALLATPDGAPLALPALVVDGPSFATLPLSLPGAVALDSTPGWLRLAAFAFAVLAAVALVVAHLRQGERAERSAWRLATVAAVLGIAIGIAGVAQLLGSVDLDAQGLRQAYDLAASRDGAVLELTVPASAELRLWSRPWVDGLRLLPAAALLWLALRQRERHASHLQPAHGPLLPIALAATALGAALIAGTHGLAGAPLALVAGLVLAAGALLSGRFSPAAPGAPTGPHSGAPALAPGLALVGAAFCWIYAWLVAPLFGA